MLRVQWYSFAPPRWYTFPPPLTVRSERAFSEELDYNC